MIMQEALFDTPVQVPDPKHAGVPPVSTIPIAAEPLGPCVKCGEPGQLVSPSGKYVYCKKHGYCGRMNENGVKMCLTSVEKFVWHERLKIWCCSCVIRFEKSIQEEAAEE